MSLKAKQKYIEYLIKKGKDFPSGESPVLINFENAVDPTIAITDSITEQFKKTNPEDYQVLEKSGKIEDYKIEIYTTILATAFTSVLDLDNKEIIKEASKIDEPEEMLAFIFVKSQEDKQVAEAFTKGIFTAYYEFSKEKGLSTDIRFKELTK